MLGYLTSCCFQKSPVRYLYLWFKDICLIFRIIRAFLIEEQKIVMKVLKAQGATKKAV